MGFYGNYFTESAHKLSLSNFKREDIKPKKKDTDVLAQYIIKWKDKNKLVANVTITQYDNGDNFIHDLDVSKEYRGNGLSYQILDIAVKEFKCNCLFVKADNKIAIHIYEKYGFKKTNENYSGKEDGLKGYIMRM